MADPLTGGGSLDPEATVYGGGQSRKEKRRGLKKLKRKQIRKEAAIREREEEEALMNDPQVQLQLLLVEKEAAENAERVRREFEERERMWLEASKAREEEEERRRKLLFEEEERNKNQCVDDFEDNEEYEYVEEGPAEIIWQGNEIIVKKKRIKIAKKSAKQIPDAEDDNRPTSNPLPPQSAAFASYVQGQTITPKELLESVAQQVPNFGTEQDKAHCPFHLKTGACRFGSRCSRVHFYPDKSCTLLVKNMYNGPGLTCEQDEGLEYTDEEIERCYEEFYEDVHTEFLKFGELVNFKVCKNSSYHLRGNVYVHYKHLDSAILACNTMNARYYAGKQIICEFVGVTKWKAAICGEYMKSRLKTCSHGSACNFIHCFRNPGGDYEWADWDNPPPRNWIKKMAVLFGPSVELDYQKELESEDYEKHSKHSDKIRSAKHNSRRHLSRSSRYDEIDNISNSSGERESNPKKPKVKPHRRTNGQNPTMARHSSSASQNEHHEDNRRSEDIVCHSPLGEDGEDSDLEENGSLTKRLRNAVNIPADHRRRTEGRESKNRSYDSRERKQSKQNHYRGRCHGIKSHADHHHINYSSEELDSEVDSGEAKHSCREQSRNRRKHEKHSSRHHRRRKAYEHKYNAAEVRKGKESSYEKLSSDESPGRWRISEGDSSPGKFYLCS